MEKAFSLLIPHLQQMIHNKLGNYIVPGLTSALVGDGGMYGKVRVFMAARDTRDTITPHSHRFDFRCLVLQGRVRNTLYVQQVQFKAGELGDAWCKSTIDQVCGADGIREYVHKREDQCTFFSKEESTYSTGFEYGMKHDQIHSITFSKDAVVLFFEGPPLTGRSEMIEPWVNGKVVPTFKTEDWMFEPLL